MQLAVNEPISHSPTPVRDPLLRAALTMLTVLTVFSALVLTLIILVPVRPSTSERDIDAQHPEERLRPSQSTGERPWIFCPCCAALIASTLRTQTHKV